MTKKGGINSGKARREQRQFKDLLENLLKKSTDVNADTFIQACKDIGINPPKAARVDDLLSLTWMAQARWDPKSREQLIKQIGQAPADPEPQDNNAIQLLAEALAGKVKNKDMDDRLAADEESGGHSDEIPP